MRPAVLALLGVACCAAPLRAQTASPAPPTVDALVAQYVERIGGLDRIKAVTTLRRSGKYTGGGGFEAATVQENKRDRKVREELAIQGLTGVTAYDGKAGWKIEPWNGKKDPEPLGEDELKDIVDDADFDGPLVDWRGKGNLVEYVGREPVEGSDTDKLKVTLPGGDVRYYYLDADAHVPIKVELKRTVRGAEREYESILGDYKQVNGWYLPFSIETGTKGSTSRQKVNWKTIEANVPVDDARFQSPVKG